MKSSKTFNNISDKLKSEIPVLKPGEVVTFQMLNGIPNPEPDEKERSKDPILYGKTQIVTNFRIFDPYQKDEEGKEVGGYVDVGCVDQWIKDEPVRFRLFVPGMGEYSKFGGKFSLTGGNIRDMELFEVLWLSNEREGNPHRDKSSEPLFKMLDLKADSKASISKVSILRKALEIAEKLKTDKNKAIEVLASLNKSHKNDDDVINGMIADLASSTPETLIKIYESKETPVKAVIKKAMDKGVLKHNTVSGKISLNNVEIHTLKVSTADALIEQLSKWLLTSENGEDVLANLRYSIEEKKEVVA